MIDERTETQASLYALGALPPDEAREFEAALRGDPQLRALVAELRATADGMAAAFPPVAPPPALKGKIMAAIHGRAAAPVAVAPAKVVTLDGERSPAWVALMPWALAACFAVLCIVLISTAKNLRQQTFSLSEQLHQRNGEVEDLYGRLEQFRADIGVRTSNEAQRLVNVQTQAIYRINEISRQAAAASNQLSRELAGVRSRLTDAQAEISRYATTNRALLDAIAFGGTAPGGPERLSGAKVAILQPTPDGPPGAVGVSVWLPQEQRGLIALDKLPPLPNPAQDYQLWLIEPNSPSPISAGVLVLNGPNSVRQEFNAVANVKTVEKFAVTVEPKGGVPKPTGKLVLASN